MILVFLCVIFVSVSCDSTSDGNGNKSLRSLNKLFKYVVCSKGADYQLPCFKQNQRYSPDDKLTTITGIPVGSYDKSLTCGRRGPMTLSDSLFLVEMQRFNREKIASRVVHAKGAGAWGTFTVTSNAIQKYSKAKLFRDKTTKILVRFSRTSADEGNADTVADIKGFAIKFFTSEGIFDLTGLSSDIFFIRDASLFPSLAHVNGRNAQTHVFDMTAYFDFMCQRNETSLAVLYLVSPLGMPASYRNMNGFGVNTFKLVDSKRRFVFCKFNYETNQGIKNLTDEQAVKLKENSPDYLAMDLYDAIARKEFPSWTLYVQIMTQDQAREFRYNPFDTTKSWPREEYPYIEVGTITLNRNPNNYFREVEQAAFNPGNMPPGIEPSPDRMLAARTMAYNDAQLHRLGPDYYNFPVNKPTSPIIVSTTDDSSMNNGKSGAMPNYVPNSYMNCNADNSYSESKYVLPQNDRTCDRYDFDTSKDLEQAREFYTKLSENDKQQTANLLNKKFVKVVDDMVYKRCIQLYTAVHADLGARLIAARNNNGK